ncbi:hypothetical protein LEN26_010614 [Aphanomyces euteiches]|nr:hypothetical protein LEN26_010614 [Aphanomyces euteiches]
MCSFQMLVLQKFQANYSQWLAVGAGVLSVLGEFFNFHPSTNMKTAAILASLAVASTTVQGAPCTVNDLTPALESLARCGQSGKAADIVSNPTGASADTVAKLCKVEDCKKAFQTLAGLSCTFTDESTRKNFKCDSSAASTTAIISGAAVIVASVLALFM